MRTIVGDGFDVFNTLDVAHDEDVLKNIDFYEDLGT